MIILGQEINRIEYHLKRLTGKRPMMSELHLAVHEAGHAVMAMHTGVGIQRVTIDGDEDKEGYCHYARLPVDPPTGDRARAEWALDSILVCLAGSRATEMLYGALATQGGWGRRDHERFERAADILDAIYPKGRRSILAWYGTIDGFLRQYANEVDQVAVGLIDYRTLTEEQVRKCAPRAASNGDLLADMRGAAGNRSAQAARGAPPPPRHHGVYPTMSPYFRDRYFPR